MTDKYTRRVTEEAGPSPFTRYGLIANPFPVVPAAEFGSLDARNNGQIFDPSIRPDKVTDFQRRFLQVPFGSDHILLGYLMSLGSVESTRGMGKTAMLMYFARELNREFGPPLTPPNQRIVAVYVSPPQSAKKFEHLAWLTVRGFIEQVHRDVFISLLLEGQARGYLHLPDYDSPEDLVGASELEARGVDVLALRKAIGTHLVTAGVGEELANAVAAGWGDPRETLAALERLPERRRLGLASHWLFNDLVNLLRAAAFTGMFWFVDELENVVNSQNARESITWAKELRTQLLDASTAARQFRFILPLFVTHTVVHAALSQAWARSGLDQFAPMHKETESYTVQLEELTTDDSRRLLRAYLDYFRLDSAEAGTLHPFTDDAIPRLATMCNYHPREILRQAHLLLQRAAEQEVPRIDAKFVAATVMGADGSTKKPGRKGSRARALITGDTDQ